MEVREAVNIEYLQKEPWWLFSFASGPPLHPPPLDTAVESSGEPRPRPRRPRDCTGNAHLLRTLFISRFLQVSTLASTRRPYGRSTPQACVRQRTTPLRSAKTVAVAALAGAEFFGGGLRVVPRVRTATANLDVGDISPLLTHLAHLEYLDLRRNDFGGVSIPKFIGSLKNLRHLDLRDAGFGGKIHPQLGNLSKLNYLDISFPIDIFHSSSSIESLHWLTGLSSLAYLDMSWWNLSAALDWLESLNMLASLQELHLRFAKL
ncbi:hypothetical protein BAE44_0018622 [Dichanthelium oligosanthes]|uniref:Uncharacterized protein n=1 Tax=Dichanthelium oligosanthes TaxID=888268 RepID=A0A1E5V5L4_9POAL|nr:hypothetical protein BAE44_0018622 [Dichanthelium oligosanthes]